MTDALLSWAGSYLLHSSLLIAGLWVMERAGLLARLGRRTQEALWRLALLGGLLSATLSVLPPVPSWVRATLSQPPVGAVRTAAAVPVAMPVAVQVDNHPRGAAQADPFVAKRPSAQLGDGALAPTRMAPRAHDLALGFVALWWAGALLMLAGVAMQWIWLRRVVHGLPALTSPRWRTLTDELAAEAGVAAPRLRHARDGWASPLLAPGGVLSLPAWCLDLPDDEARAVLGHELAHLRRRDPAWRLLAALLRALLWPQVLNRLVLRRLDLLAELACDAAAAAPAGQRLALAQSLLRCAEAVRGASSGPALACGAASAGSPLMARVRLLLKPTPRVPRERRSVRWGLVAAVLALLVAMPAVVVSHTDGRAMLERLHLGALADGLPGHLVSIAGGNTRIVSRYPGGSFSVELDGKATFNDTEDDVQTLTGTLLVREREGGLLREMKLTSMGESRIEREYRVGSERQALDDAGQRWWAQAARRMSEVLTDPGVRARRLFARGGLDAVLADLDRAMTDHSRRQRLDALLALAQPLPDAVQLQLIALTERIDGGFERREALRALARLKLGETQQLAWLKAAAGVDGDFEKREALAALAPQLLSTAPVLAAWSAVLARIDGDFELRTVLTTQVGATPQAAVLDAALAAAGRLQGDFERREALTAVARQLQGSETALVGAYARTASGIHGGFERREALSRLLDRPQLTADGIERVIESAEGMDAGFERLQVLLHVASRLGDQRSPAMVDRVRRAGRGLGDFERGQLENALDKAAG